MIECKSELYVDKLLRELRSEDFNKRALERSTEEVFSSDRSGSTKLLLQALFKNYYKSAKIVGTSLCNKILEDEECRKRLELFESPAKIILTNFPNGISNKIKNYFITIYSKVQIKEMNGYLNLQNEKGEYLEAEFLVFDDMAYFLEHDLKPREKGARCNFNNLKGALNLSKIFDDVYNKY